MPQCGVAWLPMADDGDGAVDNDVTVLKLRHMLGDRFIDVYSAVKELEHQEFMTVISPWEREHLLLHV